MGTMEDILELKASVRSLGPCVIASCYECGQHGFGDTEYEALLRLKLKINEMYGWIFPLDNDNL